MAVKLLPYRITDFENMMTNNFYYVDKTLLSQKLKRLLVFSSLYALVGSEKV